MIIKLENSSDIDTDRDLSAEERHILQKLFGWKSLVDSVKQFREKKELAFRTGWNGSGPIRETKAMSLVVQQLEKELRLRLKAVQGKNPV